MPISKRRIDTPIVSDPLAGRRINEPPESRTNGNLELRTPQVRVLKVLMPADPTDHPIDWPWLTKAHIAERTGASKLSGTITMAIRGRGQHGGSVTQRGLLDDKLVEAIELDIEGVAETNY